MAFRVNSHDLQFILQQIKIAEAHARAIAAGENPGDALRALVAANGGGQQAHLLPYGVRTVDGTFNNLLPGREDWGAAAMPFIRLTQPTYGDDQDGDQQALGPVGAPVVTNTNYGLPGNVADADPRLISNLIADQSSNNPVAVLVRDKMIEAGYDVPETPMLDQQGNPVLNAAGEPVVVYTFINIAPDAGLSAPYNSMLTIFGQFFDHGLDLVAKGGNGTVYIPLQPDDPLYDPAHPERNFMVLTRQTPDADNGVTPFVDQNQTYTSHASHQVFLREYTVFEGKTVATGHLLDGARGLPTWADVKANAREFLGIELTDADIDGVPLLRTDLYGNFIPDENGFAQVVVGLGEDGIPNTADDIVVSGTAADPASTASAVRVGVAFLNDIAHAAAPVFVDGQLAPDSDAAVGFSGSVDARGRADSYDDELLDAHYITGDGRGNENIALSAFHNMFHSEHNRIVEADKATILETGDLAFINEWLLAPIAQLPENQDAIDALVWNGERLFQAGRFSTEMQYQHLVFEEFARTIQPDIDAFVFEPSADINAAIFGEFAHAVYRLGHSMLNETVDRINPDGTRDDIRLFDAFLNPLAFGESDETGAVTLSHDEASAAIVRGLTRQAGNELDEFMTHVLRNQLVGIPLDLAALNIARGRETGLPSLNETRRQFFEASQQDTNLKPYESWADMGLNLRHPESIINFLAAYGTHDTITAQTTVDGKRDAAIAILLGGDDAPADATDFLHSTGLWADMETGLNLVDLWIGGLAEQQMINGGMLGSTFAFVFELQMENLQDGDRFYYLSRTQGLNLINELENNSLGSMFRANADGELDDVALPGHVFFTAAHTLYLDPTKQLDPDPVDGNVFRNALNPLVKRTDLDGDGDMDKIVYRGDEHIVIGGTEEDDVLVAGLGDDTVWGFGGNDRIETGYGVDVAHGGDGDDIITNAGTDIGATDFLHGEKGNDAIHGGPGLALLFGGEGNDFLVFGPDGKEGFGGEGNDFMMGGDGVDVIMGNEGDDWLEGGGRFDGMAGDNSELFFNSTIVGHDIMNGGSNDTDYDGESGDDIMFVNEGIQRANGMSGFDWVISKGHELGIEINLGLPLFDGQEALILRDRNDLVEGASGWKHDDTIIGRAFALGGAADAGLIVPGVAAAIPGVNSTIESFSNALLEKNLSLIAGLEELTAHKERFDILFDPDGDGAAPAQVERAVMDTDNGEDILLGGGGSDVIRGMGGDDIISGDQWLNVRIQINAPNGENLGSTDSMAGKIVLDGVVQFGGKTLDRLIFEGVINPGQLEAKREILDGGRPGDIDVAVYNDNFDVNAIVRNGPDEITDGTYTITRHRDEIGVLDGSYTVAHTGFDAATAPPSPDGRNPLSDGTDRLFGIENVRFANGEYALNWLLNDRPTGTPVITDLTPQEGVLNSATLGTLNEPDGIAPGTLQFQWQQSGDGGQTWADIAGGLGDTFAPRDLPGDTQVGDLLRVKLTYVDGAGEVETVYSAATGEVGDLWNGASGIDNAFVGTGGDDIAVGANPDENGAGGNDTLQGMNGNDILDGGLGTDTLIGGAGDDVYIVRDAADQIVELAGEGSDEVRSLAPAYTLSDNLETLTYIGTSDFAGTGNSQANLIVGGTGNDSLSGGGTGNVSDGLADTLVGGLGDDTYDIDTLDEEILVELAGQGSDTIRTSLNAFTLAGEPNIENLAFDGIGDFFGTGNGANNVITGGSGVNTLSGEDGDDTLLGGASNDVLNGGNGNDVLDGQVGDDTMAGGAGDDLYLLDSASDVVVEGIGAGNDTAIVSANTYRLASNIETLVFAGSGDFSGTGNEMANTLVGGSGNDTLRGANGNDVLEGRGGNNTLIGGAGIDTANYAAATAGVVANLATGGTSIGGNGFGGTDTFFRLQDLSGSAFADMLTGSRLPNRLDGGDGEDLLLGGFGNDVLLGGAGNDRLEGEAGSDTLDGGDGDDLLVMGATQGGRDFLDGGSGHDTFQLDGSAVAETFDIYTRAAYLEVNPAAVLNAATEIIVTRNGTTNILAELDNIEEIVVNTLQTTANDGNGVVNGGSSGGDTIRVFGDFTQTSLDYNTITINGSGAADKVDITALTSEHRIVFNTSGGADKVIGTLRPQDVVNGMALQDSDPFAPALAEPATTVSLPSAANGVDGWMARNQDMVDLLRQDARWEDARWENAVALEDRGQGSLSDLNGLAEPLLQGGIMGGGRDPHLAAGDRAPAFADAMAPEQLWSAGDSYAPGLPLHAGEIEMLLPIGPLSQFDLHQSRATMDLPLYAAHLGNDGPDDLSPVDLGMVLHPNRHHSIDLVPF